MNYHVADAVIRIKNAALSRRRTVFLPYSKLIFAIGTVLKKEGYLSKVEEVEWEGKKMLRASLAYDKRTPVVSEIVVISKPSLRIYTDVSEVADRERRGQHTVVLSTSKGIMTGKEAQKKKIGGELLFEVW